MCVASRATERAKPNIVLILADDLGWGDLGCYGNESFKTPRIDRLASEGARLTDFYSVCPFCAPTRASLLTGRYPFRTGVTGNPAPDAGINDIGVPESELTLAESLRDAGYRTCAIGKWHLGHKPEFYPTRHGFHEYLGILYSNDMRPVQLIDGETVVENPVVQAKLTERYTERALDFIDRNRNEPFFLYVPHAMPHKPLAASEKFYKKSGSGLYGDVMAELDWSVGQVLDKLEEHKLSKNTLVIFTSDNGPWFGGSSGSLRGMKGNTWEGGIRVPFIARWPVQIPAGHVSHEPASVIDVFPTMVMAAGIRLPDDRTIDGRDIMPLLTSDAASPHEALFSMGGAKLATVRSARWKLHVTGPGKLRALPPDEEWIDARAPDGVTLLAPYEQYHPSNYPGLTTGDKPGPMMLFDLKADPGEQHNVASENVEVVQRLKAHYDRMQQELAAAMGAN